MVGLALVLVLGAAVTVATAGDVGSDRVLIVLAASAESSIGDTAIFTLGAGMAALPAATGTVDREILENEAVVAMVVAVVVEGTGIEGWDSSSG